MRRALVLAAAVLACSMACSKRRTLAPIEQDQLRPASEWLKLEPVRDLYDYVRIDTSEARGEEDGARFLANLLACDGIDAEIVCPAPRRCNLLARLPGRRRENALLLLNHIDVAPPMTAAWKDATPFEGKISNGYLYGRGSYDMKSIAIAQALAMSGLKRAGVVPESDVLFLAEADEESEQKWGSGWILEHRPEWFRGVSAILNEGGTNEMILRSVRYWGLETLEAGYAFADLEAPAEATLKELASRWARIASTPVEPHPHVRAAFDLLANHLQMPLTDSLRHLDRVRTHPAELASLPDRYASFLEARIHWFDPYRYPPGPGSPFRGFVIVSVPPGMDPDRYMTPILSDARRSSVRILHSVSSGVTTASPYPTPFTEMIRRMTEARFPGVPFGPMPTFGGYSTSNLFRQRGFAAYGFLPLPMNITDSVRRHGPDERVFLRDYVRGVDLYSDLLQEFAAAR
jgi:acetylornithine deacetylase/succinyl-diaminopimelate desuccinylase-like protein